MLKTHTSLAIALMLLCLFTAEAQGLRCSYFFFKKNLTDDSYRAFHDMRLDVISGKSTFYSENTFLKDSLNVIAFNKAGQIVNNQAYRKISQIPSSTRDMTIADYSSETFTAYYTEGYLLYIGSKNMDLPEWTVSEEIENIGDYSCKKAVGQYLGRLWTIWYSEEIPVNAGPWLLWGAPGLIVKAFDSEDLIRFELYRLDLLEDDHRSEFLKDYNSRKKTVSDKLFKGTLKEIETLHTKVLNDYEYFCELNGLRRMKVTDSFGRDITNEWTYFPLIPDTYWKK